MAPKVVKAREARLDSHRRTTDWLWSKVELAIQLEQQKRNRQEYDRQLGLKPAAGYFGTNPPMITSLVPRHQPQIQTRRTHLKLQKVMVQGGVRTSFLGRILRLKGICRQPLPKRLDP